MADGREIVAKKLESLGYRVLGLSKKETENGVDLFAVKDEVFFSIEVKRAGEHNDSIRVPKVSHNRKNDDILAVVLDMKYVFFFEMKEHLSLCAKDGTRCITKLARLYRGK